MFTGLIEEVGKVGQVKPIAGGKSMEILCSRILEDVSVNDSVAINGVCLTVTRVFARAFWADAVGETLKKSTLNTAGSGTQVNLERALRLNDRLGGHLVQGHVNGVGHITRITRLGENYSLEIAVPDTLQRYVIDEGSIAVDGVSLTIARVNGVRLSFSIIPHTWKHTTLQMLSVGDRVNIETDLVAKYIEKLLTDRRGGSSQPDMSEDWLKKMGY